MKGRLIIIIITIITITIIIIINTHVLSTIVQMLDVITSFNSNCYPVVIRK
jgi:hypothetical protein